MSTVYNVYAEVCVGGVWYNLCPYFRTSNGHFQAGEIYSAQSVFSDVYYDLQHYARGWGVPDDMSEDLRARLERNIDTETPFPDPYSTWRDFYQKTMFYVDFSQAITPRVKKDRPYKYEGYVLKRIAAAHEVHEIDEIDTWLTEDEYKSRSDRAKKQYVFYRWNDWFGDYAIYTQLYARIRALADLFEDAMWYELDGAQLCGIADSQIRVFIDRD